MNGNTNTTNGNNRKNSNTSSGETNGSPLRPNKGKQQTTPPNEQADKSKKENSSIIQFHNQRRTSNTNSTNSTTNNTTNKTTNETKQQASTKTDSNKMNPNNPIQSLVPYQNPAAALNRRLSNEFNNTITSINTNNDDEDKFDYVEANNKAIKPVIKRTLLNDFDFVNDEYTNNEQNFNSEIMKTNRDQADNLSIATTNYVEPSQYANKDDINRWKIQRNNIRKDLEKFDYSNLFVDKYFDLNSSKNDLIKSTKGNQLIKWLRPIELIRNPILGIDTTNYKDVVQGILEDCALVSAFDTISKYPHLLRRVLELDLDLNSVEYKGCIKVNLWVREEWVSIYIDDRLPTINGKLCYSRCSRANCFWVPLLEKAFAKLEGNYQEIIGIDAAYALACLTGGLVLRLNPTHLNDREPILHYLNNSKDSDLIVGVVGSELIKNEKTERATLIKPNTANNNNNKNKNNNNNNNKPVDKRYVSTQRIGHAYSLIDVIHFSKLNKAYVKLRNCQVSMKVYKELNNERDVKLIEKIQTTLDEAKDDAKRNGIMYFSYEEFFEYFEVVNLVVILDKPIGPETNLIGNFSSTWTPNNSLMNSGKQGVNLIEKYLSSPHFLFKITNNDPTNIEAINVVLNLIAQNFNEKDFMGAIILPVRSRILGVNTSNSDGSPVRRPTNDIVIETNNFGHSTTSTKLNSFSFINYSLQRQTLSNTNPLCSEMKLLPGKYFIGLVIQSSRFPKNFTLRMASTSDSTIEEIRYELRDVGNDRILYLKGSNDRIKLVLPCCCACGCILDKSYISSGAKVFCQICYNAAFRCEICNTQVGIEYYTIEQRICCQSCLKKYKDFIEKTNFGF